VQGHCGAERVHVWLPPLSGHDVDLAIDFAEHVLSSEGSTLELWLMDVEGYVSALRGLRRRQHLEASGVQGSLREDSQVRGLTGRFPPAPACRPLNLYLRACRSPPPHIGFAIAQEPSQWLSFGCFDKRPTHDGHSYRCAYPACLTISHQSVTLQSCQRSYLKSCHLRLFVCLSSLPVPLSLSPFSSRSVFLLVFLSFFRSFVHSFCVSFLLSLVLSFWPSLSRPSAPPTSLPPLFVFPCLSPDTFPFQSDVYRR